MCDESMAITFLWRRPGGASYRASGTGMRSREAHAHSFFVVRVQLGEKRACVPNQSMFRAESRQSGHLSGSNGSTSISMKLANTSRQQDPQISCVKRKKPTANCCAEKERPEEQAAKAKGIPRKGQQKSELEETKLARNFSVFVCSGEHGSCWQPAKTEASEMKLLARAKVEADFKMQDSTSSQKLQVNGCKKARNLFQTTLLATLSILFFHLTILSTTNVAISLLAEEESANIRGGLRQSEAEARRARPTSDRWPPSGSASSAIEGSSSSTSSPGLVALGFGRQGGGNGDTLAPTEPTTVGTALSRTPTAIRNVTAQNGQSVLLHCIVEPSADVAVSWFRGSGELQLLTYESNTIIPDERFVVRHHSLAKDDDWALQIKGLDKSTDSGLYQCQTSSEPPQSQYYQLNIVEPQVHILGAPDMMVKLGASINLTCVISQSPDQLQYIFWYRDNRMINYDMNERGKIVMSKWSQKQDTITSNLQIFGSKLSDSGNYTCMPSGARPTSIYLHVLEEPNKRLTMFQNDYDPSLASSQASSAISVHVVRLSRGRAYALFVALIILSSWLQLVVQTQTAISLLLLAIIGFFLGKVTDSSAQPAKRDLHQKALEALTSRKDDQLDDQHSDKVTQMNSELGSESELDCTRHQKQLHAKDKTNFHLSNSPASCSDSSCTSERLDSGLSSSSTLRPLVRRANSASNLLKTLSSWREEDSCSIGSKRCQPRASVATTTDCAQQRGANRNCDAQKRTSTLEKPLTSPSASSSSSASTGYNSDTHSTSIVTPLRASNCREETLQVRSKRLKQRQERLSVYDTHSVDNSEMIELISQPTALRLVMDELAAGPSTPLKPARVEPFLRARPEVVSDQIQPTGATSTANSTPIPFPLHLPSVALMLADGDEPHYSSPSSLATSGQRQLPD